MRSSLRKMHPIMKVANNAVVDLPAPMNLSVWWNFGSLLGLCLVVQIVTGLLLATHYSCHIDLAFNSVIHITRDVWYGWLLRALHANGASCFFICIYFHIGRGMYYGSYLYQHTWNIGVILLFLVMGTAFLGYVLPWGQMSFWGVTVITNLLSAVPYIGKHLVEWVWGSFCVDNITLTRFFSLHFLVPFLIVGMTIFHLLFLHETGSNNPLGLNSDSEKVSFHSYYSFKDLFGFIMFFMLFYFLVLMGPYFLGDPENFILANRLLAPVHIKPEWYFLFAYAILRSIPNKLGGVIGLVGSIMMLFVLPLTHLGKFRSLSFYPFNQFLYWVFISMFLILTWIGACPVESPYEGIGQIFSFFYFCYFLVAPLAQKLWDFILDF